eukprot:1032396-Prorocentrum_lima.AAC.1
MAWMFATRQAYLWLCDGPGLPTNGMVRRDHVDMVDGRVAPLFGPQEVAIGAQLGLSNETVAQG